MRSNQELFDTVVNHLLTQNEKCEFWTEVNGYEGNNCLYHGPNGLKCAIGCLIPDDVYDKSMEGETSTNIAIKYNIEYREPEDDYDESIDAERRLGLMDDLQGVHDSWPVEQWENELREIAEKYDLDFNWKS